MESQLDIEPNETLQEFVQRHPLTVGYFTRHGMEPEQFGTSLETFCDQNQMNLEELERDLVDHYSHITRPDTTCTHGLWKALCFGSRVCARSVAPWVGGAAGTILLFWWWFS